MQTCPRVQTELQLWGPGFQYHAVNPGWFSQLGAIELHTSLRLGDSARHDEQGGLHRPVRVPHQQGGGNQLLVLLCGLQKDQHHRKSRQNQISANQRRLGAVESWQLLGQDMGFEAYRVHRHQHLQPAFQVRLQVQTPAACQSLYLDLLRQPSNARTLLTRAIAFAGVSRTVLRYDSGRTSP